MLFSYFRALKMTDRKLIICACLLYEFKLLFLQDNARPHVAKITLAKIAELKWEIMFHPPYSPARRTSPKNFWGAMKFRPNLVTFAQIMIF